MFGLTTLDQVNLSLTLPLLIPTPQFDRKVNPHYLFGTTKKISTISQPLLWSAAATSARRVERVFVLHKNGCQKVSETAERERIEWRAHGELFLGGGQEQGHRRKSGRSRQRICQEALLEEGAAFEKGHKEKPSPRRMFVPRPDHPWDWHIYETTPR